MVDPHARAPGAFGQVGVEFIRIVFRLELRQQRSPPSPGRLHGRAGKRASGELPPHRIELPVAASAFPEPTSMTPDVQLSVLLDRWLALRRQGQDVSLTDLCRECPELVGEVEHFLAVLGRMQMLNLLIVPPPATDPTSEDGVPPTAPPHPATPPTTVGDSASPAASVPGSALSDYELLGVLGQGGMAIVYKARQVKAGRIVALKMILFDGRTRSDPKRFHTEAEAIARLQHPNIVQVYEIRDYVDGAGTVHPYFTLEFCAGGSLERKLQGTPLEPPEAANLVEKLARAVQHAHERGVLHRDLKPANVLLTTDGTPKITDFGLAKMVGMEGLRLGPPGSLTHTGAVMGTPSYMPPEQARGSKELGPPADVWALGAVLYECLTGRPPFKAASTMDTLLQVMHDDPAPPREINPRVPRDLETICLKCLQKDPTRRYASAYDLAGDLARFQEGVPIGARPVGVVERLVKWARRYPAVAGLLTTVVLLTLTALVVITVLYGDALRQRDLARRREQDADRQRHRARLTTYGGQLQLAARELRAGEVDTAARTLDDCPADLRNWEWRHLKRGLASRLERQVLGGRGGPVTAVAFFPDSRRVVTGSQDGRVTVWDAPSGHMLLSFKGHSAAVNAVAVSPDGHYLLTGGDDSAARLWDAHTGEEKDSLREHNRAVTAVAFSPDGRLLATGGRDNQVRLWPTRRRQSLHTFDAHRQEVSAVAFTPDGKRLVTTSLDGTTRLWDVDKLRLAGVLERSDRGVTDLAVHPDGSRLATSCQDGTTRVWDTATGRNVLTLRGHLDAVHAVTFTADGSRIVTAGQDGTTRVWDAGTALELANLRGHGDAVQGVAASPDGCWLVTCGRDGTARVWGLWGELPVVLRHDRDEVLCVALSPDGALAATGGKGGAVRVWDAATGLERLSLASQAGPVMAVAFHPAGGRLIAASGNTARLWDVATGQPRGELTGHANQITCLACAADGRIATGGRDGKAVVWNAAGEKELLSFQKHTEAILCIAFSPDGQRVASGGEDRGTRLWDARTGRELLALPGHGASVTAVAFDPTGERIATASMDRTVKLRNSSNGAGEITLPHPGPVYGVTFSRDGQRVITVGEARVVRVWDAATGLELLSLPGHAAAVQAVAISGDGVRLATASRDGTARVWGSGGPSLLALAGHTSPIKGVALAGDRVVSRSEGTVLVFDAVTGERRDLERTVAAEVPHAHGADDRVLAWARGEGLFVRRGAGRERDRQDALAWHRHQVHRCQVDGAWFAVRFHAQRLLALVGPDALVDAETARGLAALARRERQGELVQWWMRSAVLRRDAPEQRDARAMLLSLPAAEPEQARQVAQGCALTPLDAPQAGTVLALAERAAKARRSHAGLSTLALAQLRARRPWDALTTLGESLREGRREGRPVVLDELLLALAHAEVDHRADAQRWRDRARAWFAAAEKRMATPAAALVALAGKGPLRLLPTVAVVQTPRDRWHRDGLTAVEWADLEVLRREVEAPSAKP
jgi:WD40 repeat protein/tRNA A-37 threonylcarbamoyl transferase component Bud32